MEDITLESLALKIEELQSSHQKLQAENLEFKNVIANSTKIDAAAKVEKTPEIPKDIVTVKGKKYQFTVASFKLPGEKYQDKILSQDAVNDTEVLEDILQVIGQRILKAV